MIKKLSASIHWRTCPNFVFVILFWAQMTSGINAQTINPYLMGQNAWMPSWIKGSCLNELWDEMQTAGFQTIRIGGNQAMNDNKDFAKVIELIDGVRSAGAEPIVQVPHDYSTQQTIAYIKYLNGTMGKGIKMWCIGNEPKQNKVGNAAFVGEYMRRIGSALKTVDPSAVVMGPETAYYNTSYLSALVGGSEDVTGIDANGNYPIDIITWHKYNFNTASGIEANVDDMLPRLAAVNLSRPVDKHLGWGITEINMHWDMNRVTDPEQYTWSFHAGQIFAEVYDIGMRKGGFTICPWSMHEHEGDRSGTDLSLFDSSAEGFAGRSTYYHSLMLGQNMRSRYLTHTDNQSDVTVIPMTDDRGISVMILNKSRNKAFDYTLRLDTHAASASTLDIQVDAGLDVEYSAAIPAFSTHMLVFDEAGVITKQYEYTSQNSANQVGPDISTGHRDDPLDGAGSSPVHTATSSDLTVDPRIDSN